MPLGMGYYISVLARYTMVPLIDWSHVLVDICSFSEIIPQGRSIAIGAEIIPMFPLTRGGNYQNSQ